MSTTIQSTPAVTARAGGPDPLRWKAIAVLGLIQFMLVLDIRSPTSRCPTWLFTGGLASCGAAVDPALLVASRFVQGLGEALAAAGDARADRDRRRPAGGSFAPVRAWQVLGPVLDGLGLAGLMVWIEARSRAPLIPLSFPTGRAC
jgi:hypothetical protein